MAKTYPAFMNATGMVIRILEKIKAAATPQRFTQDFLVTELGFPGGGAKAFIPLAKKMGILSTDGSPTDLYKQFRNTNVEKSREAMGKALKNAYPDIYTRNEYAHNMSKSDLEGILVEITGLEKGNSTIRAIIGTFEAIKSFASFNTVIEDNGFDSSIVEAPIKRQDSLNNIDESINLGLSYTINLVLPKTDDVAVFNAIFKSLKEHLLRK